MSGNARHPFHEWLPLAEPRLGTRVVAASDEFFGAKERLIEPAAPVFIPDRYDDHGKWMDGWESRRRRGPGHDWCIIRLGIPALVRGVDIDTSHFTGNFPPEASIDACVSDAEVPGDDAGWWQLLPRVPLSGNARHPHAVDSETAVTHLRLNIYPDGGVARLRVFGEIRPDFSQVADATPLDLLAIENGGRALAASDEHFGSMHNLNAAGRGVNMGDGWETARRRGPGYDWCLLALGHRGVVDRVVIDTAHFKGNYPDRASLRAADVAADGQSTAALTAASEHWPELLPETKLGPDREHEISRLVELGPVSHLRLAMFPDGGISRLRVYGRLARD